MQKSQHWLQYLGGRQSGQILDYGSILLQSIEVDEFFKKMRAVLKREIELALQQDQLLTKEVALKMAEAHSVFGAAIFRNNFEPFAKAYLENCSCAD